MWVANTTGGYDLVEAVVVTFDADNAEDDSDVTTQKIQKGTKVEQPEDPTKENSIFDGWYAGEADEAFDFETEINENLALTAQWTAAAASVDGTLYATFAEAVASAAGEKTIVLLAAYDGTYEMTAGTTLIVDKNGYKFNKPTVAGEYVVNQSNVGTVYTFTTTDALIEYTALNGTVSYKTNLDYTNVSGSGTYKLLGDVTAATRIVDGLFATNVTIDLNGHTLTSAATDYGIYFTRANHSLTITDSSENKGGKLVANSADQAICITGSGNTVTIDAGVTVEGACVAIFGSNQTLNVNGTINGGDDFAVATNGAKTSNATININSGAVLTSNTVAMYLPASGTTTIAGSVTGTTAVYAKSATVVINEGAELTGTGAAAEYSYNGNGCNPTGDALVLDNCGYPGGVGSVTVNGGSFTAINGGKGIGSYAYGETTTGVARGLAPVHATGNSITVPDTEMWVANTTGGYDLVEAVTITFYANGGIGTMDAQKVGKNVATDLNENAFTRANYVFIGWNTAANGSGTSYTDKGTITIAEQTTLFAQWANNVWTIQPITTGSSLSTDGKTLSYANQTVDYSPINASKGRNWVAAWVGAKVIAPESVTVANLSTVKYDRAGNTGVGTDTASAKLFANGNDGTTADGRYYMEVWVPLTAENVRTAIAGGTARKIYRTYSFYFEGEAEKQAFTVEIDPTNIILTNTQNVENAETIKVVNAKEIFTVTFDSNGGSEVASVEVADGDTVEAPTAPTKANYVFDGWYKDETEWKFDTNTVTANITLKAEWNTAVASITKGDPAVTSYYATVQDAVDAAESGDTVKLLADVTLEQRVEVNKNLTIDLNGKTVTPTATCSNGSAFDIKAGTVEIKNGKIDGSAITDIECDPITVRSGATLTLNDGIEIVINSKNGACVYAFDGGKIVINGGTYENQTTETYQYNQNMSAMVVNQANVESQLIEIKGGTFKGFDPQMGDDSGKAKTFVASGYVALPDSVTTIGNKGTYNVVEGYNVTFDTDGGKPAEIEAQRVQKNGKATKPADPTKTDYAFAGWFAEGATDAFDFNIAVTADTKLKAKWNAAVASITKTVEGTEVTSYYATVQDAVDAAADGDTVKLLANVTLAQRVEVNKNLTIDLNGKTVTPTATCSNGSAFDIKAGTVEIKNGKIDGSAITDIECDPITVRSGATLTLNDGIEIVINSKNGACVYAFDGGKIVINGGTYENQTTETYQYNQNMSAMVVNQANVESQLIEIKGGTFKGFDPQMGDDSGKAKTFVASSYVALPEAGTEINAKGTFKVEEGYNVTFDTNGGEPEPEAQRVKKNGKATKPETPTKENFAFAGWFAEGATEAFDFDSTLTADTKLKAKWNDAVASITKTVEGTEVTSYYATLAAAVEAAENDTIVMLKDVTESVTIPVGKTITINLNGKVITGSKPNANGNATIMNNGTLTVVDSSTDAEKPGKIVSTNNFAIATGDDSTTTIGGTNNNNFAIESVEGALITGRHTGATISINGGTLSASDNAVVAGNGTSGYGNNIINITGGTFNGGITSAGYVACGIYAPNNDIWNISGGTFNITGGAGIVQRAGTVNVSGNVIINTTGNVTGKVGDSRVVVPCAALVFDSEAGYPEMTETAKLSVTGGTFESECEDAVVNVGEDNRIDVESGSYSKYVELEDIKEGSVCTSKPYNDGYYHIVQAINFTFSANGGEMENGEKTLVRVVPTGETIPESHDGMPENPTNEDPTKAFDGWYTGTDLSSKFDFNTPINDSSFKTVYAKWSESVAKIGEVYYPTLAAAFEAAKDGDEITLVADIELPRILTNEKNVTLNLNGHTIEEAGSRYIRNEGTLTLKDSSEAKEGGIIGTTYGIYNKGTLNIAGGNIAASKYGVCQVGENNPVTNVTGGVITAQTAIYAKAGEVTASGTPYILGTKNDVQLVSPAKAKLSGGYYNRKVAAGNIVAGKVCTTEENDEGYYQIVDAITVTFNLNEGKIGESEDAITVTVPFGEAIKAIDIPADPVKDGYEFKAWQLNDVDYSFDTKVTQSIVLKAAWTAKNITVNFDVDGGDAVEPMSGAYGTTIPLPEAKKTGATFLGWKQGDGNPMAVGYEFQLPAEDVTLTAQWADTEWTLTLPYTAGTLTEDGAKFENLTLNFSPADPSIGRMQDGYWVGYKFIAPEAVTAENIAKTIYSNDGGNNWKSFKTYNDGIENGRYIMQAWVPLTVESVEAFVAAKQTMKWTYKFAWDGNEENAQTFVIEVSPEDVVLNKNDGTDPQIKVVDWEIVDKNENLDVTFVDEDGTKLADPQSVRYNAKATEPETPTKEHYSFKAWQLNGEDYEFDTPVTESIELKATWTIDTFTITFVDEDGTKLDTQTVAYGDTPVYGGEEPIKAADAQYTYAFNGWTPAIVKVTGNATYKATYTTETNKYKVTFVDEDGTTVLKEAMEYDYGTAAADIVKPADPTKEADEQYTYTFAGWTPEIEAVTGEATYTATYSETVNEYTITFVDEDGTELQSTKVPYGEMPVYTGDEPTKEADAQYTYSFKGWDPEIEAVTGEATYTASYTGTVNKYMIKFVNEDYDPADPEAKALYEDEFEYGETPTYDFNKGIPTKAANGNIYTFAGWDPEIKTVTGEATYKATYTGNPNTFTIKFVDENGSLYDVITEKYGTDITAPANPTKNGYTFTGWNPAVPETMPAENMTITATWKRTTWELTLPYTSGTLTEDGAKFENLTLNFSPADPSIGRMQDGYWVGYKFIAPEAVTAENIAKTIYSNDGGNNWKSFKTYNDGIENGRYIMQAWVPLTVESVEAFVAAKQTMKWTYKFAWDGNEENAQTFVIEVSPEDVVLNKNDGTDPQIKVVDWEIVDKNENLDVTFVDEDGTKLADPQSVRYNAKATEPETPTKEHYSFKAWQLNGEDYEFDTPVTESIELKATWTIDTFTITFVDEDGTKLDTQTVAYGDTPSYTGDEPAKEADAQYTYAFKGWTPEIEAATENATYTATYSETVNEYTIAFVDEDGTELNTQTVAYGEMPAYTGDEPTKEADAQYTYAFKGWTPEIEAVTGEATYTATYSETVNEYTITFVDEDGTELQSTKVPYGETPTYGGQIPTKTSEGHTCTFKGWDPEIIEVTGETTYTATYTDETNVYTLRFFDEDGRMFDFITEPYGTAIEIPKPTKIGYTVTGWIKKGDSEATEVAKMPTTMPAEDATYTVKWSVSEYTITFQNEDGTELQSSKVKHGEMPAYTGEMPEKAADAEHIYTFKGWDTEIVAATGDAIYTASYEEADTVASITRGDPAETTYYETFAKAAEAAKDGDVIELLKDAEEPYTLDEGETLKVQKDDHDLTVNGAVATIESDDEPVVTTYYSSFADAAEDAGEDDVIMLVSDNEDPYTLEEGKTLKVKAGDHEPNIVAPEGKTVKAETDPDTGITTYKLEDAVYTIIYELNGGENDAENPTSYSAGMTADIELKPAKDQEYYKFAGWYSDENLTMPVAKIAAGTKGDITLYAKYEDTVTFQTTLNMADYTGIYVYIHVPEDVNPEEYTVQVNADKSIYAEESKSVLLSSLDTRTRARGEEQVLFYQVDAIHAASPEMTDVVTVKLLKGAEIVHEEEYSVRNIAEERLKSGTLPDNQVAIHKALLQYGHYGQLQFKGGQSDMEIPDGAPALVSIPSSFAPSGDPTNFSAYISKFDARADLAAAISMNVYLTPASGYTLNDFVITVTDKDGKAYKNYSTPVMDGGRIYFKIEGMRSPQIGRDFNINVKLKKDTSKTATWTRSVMSCAYTIQQTNTNPTTQNLVKALYQYYQAAAALWPSLM